MKTFPMFLRMAGRRVLILGGGEQPAQKTRLMLKTEAEIVVVARTASTRNLPTSPCAAVSGTCRKPRPSSADGALAFVATGEDAHLAALTRAAGIATNVVVALDLCDAFTPFDRRPRSARRGDRHRGRGTGPGPAGEDGN